MPTHRPPDKRQHQQRAQNRCLPNQLDGKRQRLRNARAMDRLKTGIFGGCVALLRANGKNVGAFGKMAVVRRNHLPRYGVGAVSGILQAHAEFPGIGRVNSGICKIHARSVGPEDGNAGDASLDALAEMDQHFGGGLREHRRCGRCILERSSVREGQFWKRRKQEQEGKCSQDDLQSCGHVSRHFTLRRVRGVPPGSRQTARALCKPGIRRCIEVG